MNGTENILISVERKYVARMLSGSKTVELRRRAMRLPLGTKVWIYSTAPQAQVEAVAKIGAIVSGQPQNLWNRYQDQAGVTREEFDRYFADAALGWCVVLQDIRPLRSAVTLATLRTHTQCFHPPQFFMRLREGCETLDLLRSVS